MLTEGTLSQCRERGNRRTLEIAKTHLIRSGYPTGAELEASIEEPLHRHFSPKLPPSRLIRRRGAAYHFFAALPRLLSCALASDELPVAGTLRRVQCPASIESLASRCAPFSRRHIFSAWAALVLRLQGGPSGAASVARSFIVAEVRDGAGAEQTCRPVGRGRRARGSGSRPRSDIVGVVNHF